MALAVLKGLLLVFLIPPFQTPDEYGHYDYALYLSHVRWSDFLTGRIAQPVALSFDAVSTRELQALVDVTDTREHGAGIRLHKVRTGIGAALGRAAAYEDLDDPAVLARAPVAHPLRNYPPLFYWLVACLHRAARAAGANILLCFYLARLWSLALFIGAVVVSWRVWCEVGLSSLARRVALLVFAFQPEWSMLSASVQPDNLGLLSVTAGTLFVARLARAPDAHTWRRDLVRLAAALGVTWLVKLHFFAPLGAVAATMVGWRWRSRRDERAAIVRHAVVAVGVVAAIGGWWYLRSFLLYGNLLGIIHTQRAPLAQDAWTNLLSFIGDVPSLTFPSYWGFWGWLDYRYPPALDPWLACLCLVPAFVYAFDRLAARTSAGGSGGGPLEGAAVWPWLAFLGGLFAVEMAVIAAALGGVANQGRHWLTYGAVQTVYLVGVVDVLGRPGRRMRVGAADERRPWWAGRTLRRVAFAVVLVTFALSALDRRVSGTLVVRALSDVDSQMQVFVDSGRGISAREHDIHAVRPTGTFTELTFAVRASHVGRLRLDPLMQPGRVRIASIELLDRSGRSRQSFDLRTLVALSGVASIAPTPDGVEIVVPAHEVDPALALPLAEPVDLETTAIGTAWDRLRQAYRAVARRSALVGVVVDWWPVWLAGAIAMTVVARLRAGRVTVWARSTWALALAGVVVYLNLWLGFETLRFYYRS